MADGGEPQAGRLPDPTADDKVPPPDPRDSEMEDVHTGSLSCWGMDPLSHIENYQTSDGARAVVVLFDRI